MVTVTEIYDVLQFTNVLDFIKSLDSVERVNVIVSLEMKRGCTALLS